MMAKLKQMFVWLKDKWFFVAGGLLTLVGLMFVGPRKKIINSLKRNTELEAKIYDLSEASAKKLKKGLSDIDRQTEEKIKNLENSKKELTSKFQEERDERIKELSTKSVEELAGLLKSLDSKNKKD